MNPTLDLCSTRIRGQAGVETRARPIATGFVLVGADAAGLMTATALATSLWLLVNPAAGGYYGMWSTAPLCLATYAVLGLYPGVGLSPVEELRRKGGGAVAVQLVGNHVDSTVNNPIEAVAHWRAGKLRPLCVFDSKKLDYHDKIAGDLAWDSIPTCKSEGIDIEYLMLRGYFMPPGVSKDEVAYYVDMFKKVRETPEWKKLMDDGAFNQSFMAGPEYTKWVADAEKLHEGLMKSAGFLAKTN